MPGAVLACEAFLFGLVKSKCYDDSGRHLCTKLGHSCVRRVIDASGDPFRSSWRVAARGVRAVAGTRAPLLRVRLLQRHRERLVRVEAMGC